MRVDVEQRVLIRLQVIANDVAVSFGEFLIGCDGDVRRRAAALMGFVFGAEIDQYTIAILSECLDGFDCSKQRGVDVSFSEEFRQGGRRALSPVPHRETDRCHTSCVQ